MPSTEQSGNIPDPQSQFESTRAFLDLIPSPKEPFVTEGWDNFSASKTNADFTKALVETDLSKMFTDIITQFRGGRIRRSNSDALKILLVKFAESLTLSPTTQGFNRYLVDLYKETFIDGRYPGNSVPDYYKEEHELELIMRMEVKNGGFFNEQHAREIERSAYKSGLAMFNSRWERWEFVAEGRGIVVEAEDKRVTFFEPWANEYKEKYGEEI